MKKLLIKILPFLVAFMMGVVMYIFTEKLVKDSGLNNLLINIASGLISIPLVFIFYDVINKITSRNLHNSIFESVTFEINTQLLELIRFICSLLQIPTPQNTSDLDNFLELETNEISHQLTLHTYQIQIPEDIKKQLLTIIHKQTSLEILSEQQISAILSIIKETTYLIKDLTQKNNLKSLKLKNNIVQNITDIIDNLTIWIENGQKDAFHNHARFTLTKTINEKNQATHRFNVTN